MSIAIDGPSGSGKTTTARLVAERLALTHIDTGAMYRAVALAAAQRGISPHDGEGLGRLAAGLDIRLEGTRVLLEGGDVSADIRTPQVTADVSPVSAHPAVRAVMVALQREHAARGGVVLEGRDIGSVVLPAADVKIYLNASLEVRAVRRHREMVAVGSGRSVAEVEAELARRDHLDSSRADSPLVKPVGSWEVDTTGLTIDGQVEKIVDIAERTSRRLAEIATPGSNPSNPRRERGIFRLSRALIRWNIRFWLGLRIENHHDKTLEENYIIACNHSAYVDPPFVGCTISRESHFMAKSGLFTNPHFSRLISYFNAIPIRRGVFDRAAMQRAAGILHRGRSLMIFPEGGRHLGPGLGKPKSGIGYLALTTGVPVLPVYISGSNDLRRCLLRKKRMVVRHGKPIRIPPEIAAGYADGTDREAFRRFSEIVMHAIAELRGQVEGPEQ